MRPPLAHQVLETGHLPGNGRQVYLLVAEEADRDAVLRLASYYQRLYASKNRLLVTIYNHEGAYKADQWARRTGTKLAEQFAVNKIIVATRDRQSGLDEIVWTADGRPNVPFWARATSGAGSSSGREMLRVHGWRWDVEHRFAVVQGEVENISGRRLSRAMVVASFYTSDGQFITAETSFIEYNPIMPGQRSPFKVMARHNPLMASVRIDFKEFGGGAIPWI